MTSVQTDYSRARAVDLGSRSNGPPRKTSVLERKSTFEAKEMKSPPPRSLSLADGNSPVVGKAVKEGLVSQIASRFQQQQQLEDSRRDPRENPRPPDAPKKPLFRYPTDPSSSRSGDSDENSSKKPLVKRPVTRTESHHARFNSARAMFEKMGSADELDAVRPGSRANPASRASSVGRRPGSRSSDENCAPSNGTICEDKNTYSRSRSISPRASSLQQRGGRISREEQRLQNGHHETSSLPSSASYQNGLAETTAGIVKTRRLSFQQKEQSCDALMEGVSEKRQQQHRSWFPGKTQQVAESVDSPRRMSVQNTPNLVSGGGNGNSSIDSSSPLPSANLDLPGDRRPLSARTSTSSDSIEDYIRNWKKSSPSTSPTGRLEEDVEEAEKSLDQRSEPSASKTPTSVLTTTPPPSSSAGVSPVITDKNSPSLASVDPRGGRVGNFRSRFEDAKSCFSASPSTAAGPSKPLLSPKPNADLVKRSSFSKKSSPAIQQQSEKEQRSDEVIEMVSSTSIRLSQQTKSADAVDRASLAVSSTESINNNAILKSEDKRQWQMCGADAGVVKSPSVTQGDREEKTSRVLCELKQPPDENTLFQSLEPSECRKIEEEFDRLTSSIDVKTVGPVSVDETSDHSSSTSNSDHQNESNSNNIPFADEDASSVLVEAGRDHPKEEKAITAEAVFNDEQYSPVEAVNRAVKPARLNVSSSPVVAPQESEEDSSSALAERKESLSSRGGSFVVDSGSEADEFQDEIHFDPTISSGHFMGADGGFRNTPITLGGGQSQTATPAVDEMTPTEAENMLSTELSELRGKLLSDEQAEEVTALLTPPEKDLPPLPKNDQETPVTSSDIGSSIDSWTANRTGSTGAGNGLDSALDKLDSLVYNKTTAELQVGYSVGKTDTSGKASVPRVREAFYDEQNDVHVFEDGHYWFEIPGIDGSSALEDLPAHCYKAPGRLRFSSDAIRQFSTYAVDDYDRRNDEVDPVAASAEYELEKRVEKMDTFPVDLRKGADGLGLSIIGMGVGADTGLEKLGIFVKTITPGGSAERDGRIKVNDQIIEVDGRSLVGVTQAYAASVLRNTSGVVQFIIGRDKDPENSEVAQLIRQSLQPQDDDDDSESWADKERAERQREYMAQLEREASYDSSEPTSMTNSSTQEGELTIQGPEELQRKDDVGEEEQMHQQEDEEDEDEDKTLATTPDEEGKEKVATTVPAFDETPDKEFSVDDMVLLRQKLEEAQYQNTAIEEEMLRIQSKISNGSTNDPDRQFKDADEKKAYEEEVEALHRKYNHAKRIIAELKRHEQFLAVQLQERDHEYNSHLRLLRERVLQLESELATTQKFAGMPVRLPYEGGSLSNGNLSPPELLKQPPIIPDEVSMDGEISETEDSIKEDLDAVIPFHQLLDVSANKSKAELAHKGSMMAQRQRPSTDALRTAILKRSVSSSSTTDSAVDSPHTATSASREETPDSADSGFNTSIVVTSTSSKIFQKPSMPLPTTSVPNLAPNAHNNSLLQEIRQRQESSSTYANLPPVSPQVSQPTQQHPVPSPKVMGVALPGMNESPLGSPGGPSSPAGTSLADQLKSRLEERRRSKEGESSTGACVPESIAADIEQAVKVANENVRKITPPSSSCNTSSTSFHQSVMSPQQQPPHLPLHSHNNPHHHTTTTPQPPPPSSLQHSYIGHPHPPRYNYQQPRLPPPYPATPQVILSQHTQQQYQPHHTTQHPGNAGHVPYSPVASGLPQRQQQGHPQQPQQYAYRPPTFAGPNQRVPILLPQQQQQQQQVSMTASSYGSPSAEGKANFSMQEQPVHRSYIEPSDAGVIPPEYRTSFPTTPKQRHPYQLPQQQGSPGQQQQHDLPGSREVDPIAVNQVEEWAKEQVCQWLLAFGMESYITLFMNNTISGETLLNLDGAGLKELGIKNKEDREKIKKKIKELKAHNDREKREAEKERAKRDKLLKKAEKANKRK